VPVIAALLMALPTTVVGIAVFLWGLEPELRRAVVTLARALRDRDEEATRLAYEAARRVAFAARQR